MIRALKKISAVESLHRTGWGSLGGGVGIGLRYVVVGLLGGGACYVVGLWVPMWLLFRSVPS